MSRALFVVSLLAGWLLLWGDMSPANVLTGLLLIAVLFVVVPSGRPDTGPVTFRPVALARLLLLFAGDLVLSNVVLARMVLRRNPATTSGVVAVRVADCTPGLLAFIANLIALSPGAMAVATSNDPATIYVHVLQLDDAGAQRRVERLAGRAIAAFGSPPPPTGGAGDPS